MREKKKKGGGAGMKIGLAIVVVAVVAGIGLVFHNQSQQRAAESAARSEVSSAQDRVQGARNVDDLRKELAWFAEHTEHESYFDESLLARERKRLAGMELESEFSSRLAAAEEAGSTDKEAAKARLRDLIAWCEQQGADFASRVPGLNDRIVRLDPEDEKARTARGDVFVQVDIPNLSAYELFFADELTNPVTELQKYVEGKYLPEAKAAEATAVIEEYSGPVKELIAQHEGDPYFKASLQRIQDVLADENFKDEEFVAYYDDTCLTLQAKSGSKKARRHLAIMNLASMKFAKDTFARFAESLPQKLERSLNPMMMISLKDKKAYDDYNEKIGMGDFGKKARAYFTPGKLWIITYNENIFDARFFKHKSRDMITTSVHEGFHHIRFLHQDQGVPLVSSHQFEEGFAEYTAGVIIDFDLKTEICTIEHVGWNKERMDGYCHPQGGRDNKFFPRLSLQELIGLHDKSDESRIAKLRAQASGNPYSEGAENTIFGLVYSQGYSFIYYCYQGSGGKYKSQMDCWRAWQWSADATRSHMGSGYEKAWRKFKECFGDVATLEKEWRAWEDSLDSLRFGYRTPTGDPEESSGGDDEGGDDEE